MRPADGGDVLLYLVIAKDSQDAAARRQAARPAHLEALTDVVKEGRVKLAGAITDDSGSPRGSALLVEAEDLAEVRRLLEDDIYSREGVWGEFEIYPFRQAF